MTASAEDAGQLIPTVADAIAAAEAWNERAAVLSTMAFELRTVFGPLHGSGPPPYLIRRIGGGASPVSAAVIEQLRTELFEAAERARDEARTILLSATSARLDGHALGLTGSDASPSVDFASLVIPSGGDEVVANAECPRGHQKLGEAKKVDGDEAGEERRLKEGRVLRAVEPAPARSIRPMQPRARTR